MAKLPSNITITTKIVLPIVAPGQDANLVGKPKQFEKTTKIWKAFLSKLKFDFIRRVLRNVSS